MELELVTERLRLTPFATDDVDLAVEMWTDPEVVKYICDVMSAWGRGYASEVCKRLLQFAFQEVTLNEVVASVDEENVASKKVLEKCGLLSSGRTRCYGKDSPIYRISRDKWDALQQP